MALTKEQKAEKERQWGIDNNNPKAFCEGKSYNTRKGYEKCLNREKCSRYKRYQDYDKNWINIPDEVPEVKFYYIANFRNCPHRFEDIECKDF